MTMKSTRRASKRAKEEIQDLSKFPSEDPNPVLRVARDGTLLYINKAGMSLLPQWHLAVGHASPPLLREAVFRSMDTGSTQELDLEHGGRVYSFFVAPIVTARYANLYGRDITERKRADAALRESEARLRAIASHTPDHILFQDRDLRYRLVINPQLGLTEADMIGKTDRDFLAKKDAEKLTVIKRRVMETGEPFQLETSLKNSKGQTEFFEGAYIPKVDATGKVDGLIGYFRNITERKRAEEALRYHHEMLQAILDNIPVMIAFLNREGQLQFVNRCWQSTLGWSLEEAQSKDVFVEMYPDPAYRESLRDYIKAAAGTWADFKTKIRDGRVLDTTWVNVPLLDGSNIGIGIDVTERKREEEALRNRESMLQKIFDLLPVGLWFADKDGTLLRGNPAGVKIWGAEPRVTLADSGVFKARRLPSGKEVAPDDWALAHTIRDKVTIVDELLEIDAFDGKTKTILNYTAPVLDAQGEVQGAIVVNQDITERKRAEERMRTFSHEIIAAREEERKQVSSVLHHDVGSLTVGVSAHLSAIEEDLRSGKPEEALKWTKRTRRLFDESVARLKEVAVQLRPPELDLLGLRAALRQHFSQVTKHGRTRIHFRETLGPRRVSGDTATTLFRVAQETLTNAITHGDAKQVDVFLSASRKEVKLTVRDNGKGFSRSGQPEQATSRMGLHVMKEMAASCGGGFQIHSRRGKGTTVRVNLPYQTEALRPGDKTVRQETVARGKTTRSAGRGSRRQKGSGA